MIEPTRFIKELERNEINFFVEVPCSILKPLINAMMDQGKKVITPANEAVVMGIASGYYMATGKIPFVMMQNSGFLNTLNALTSLNQLYKIPVLYGITWRGETKEAPEHDITGEKTEDFLKTFDLPYRIVTEKSYADDIKWAVDKIKETDKPAALLIRKGLFNDYSIEVKQNNYTLTKENVIGTVVDIVGKNSLYVSTNGYPSRQLFSILKERRLENEIKPFYMIGSMGHALPISHGIALSNTDRKVIVFDGDGGALMHMGAMCSVKDTTNLIHIILDNEAHASTGGQPTVSSSVDFARVAEGCGYAWTRTIKDKNELVETVESALKERGPVLLHVKLSNKPEKVKERVSDKYNCEEVKENFMKIFEK